MSTSWAVRGSPDISIPQPPSKIFARFGEKYGVDGAKVSSILKATAFKQPTKQNEAQREVTDEQMAALLVVAEQYHLNPFVKEIYAFPDKQNGIVPVIGVDGWTRIANEHPQFDGVEFRYSETSVTIDSDAKPCPEWVECVVYRKDRGRPTIVREHLDECYRAAFTGRGNNGGASYKVPGPWQSHTKRFLRHKAFSQATRMAFGFAGIYDEDEAARIAEARVVDIGQGMQTPIDVEPDDFKALSVENKFAIIIDRLGFADQEEKIEAYLGVCAKHFGISIYNTRAEICKRPDEFVKQYTAWLKSVEQKKQIPAEQPAQAEPATPDFMVYCPKADKNVDSRTCDGKPCRKGCPEFDD